MDQIVGSLGAAPIWRVLMERFLSQKPIEKFTVPSGVSSIPICRNNGYSLKTTAATSSAMVEYFLPGTGPTRSCDGSFSQGSPTQPSGSPTPTGETPTPTPEEKKEKDPTPTETVIEIPVTLPPNENNGQGNGNGNNN